jgi:hypothetical protein
MQALLSAGYVGEALQRLNRVCILLQLLFMSDILTASGNKIDTAILLLRSSRGEIFNNAMAGRSTNTVRYATMENRHAIYLPQPI